MFLKITLGLIFLQTAVIQIFTRGQVLNDAVESQLINLREGQRLHSDEIHEVYEKMDGLETKLEKIKDLLCAGCKGNTTTTTTQKPNTEPRKCQEWLQETGRSGTYIIKPSCSSNLTFKAYCLIKKDRVGVEGEEEASFWTVILRRKDYLVDFNRSWTNYQSGFGNLDGEFILGLDYIHELTRSAQQELWVALQRKDDHKGYAKYDNFVLGNSTESYMLNSLGHFSGNVNDALTGHVGFKWSTNDVINNHYAGNCAEFYGGGWWYRGCQSCCLTGFYNCPKEKGKWRNDWSGFARKICDIKYALMAVRDFKQ